jgi:hypothetical protein
MHNLTHIKNTIINDSRHLFLLTADVEFINKLIQDFPKITVIRKSNTKYSDIRDELLQESNNTYMNVYLLASAEDATVIKLSYNL